jgi:hypothetical protein
VIHALILRHNPLTEVSGAPKTQIRPNERGNETLIRGLVRLWSVDQRTGGTLMRGDRLH